MDIFELIKAAIIGIVEGITEWLPISSTGHMILVDEFLPLRVSPEFLSMFLVIIQLGAILAVILLYFKRLNPFSPSKTPAERRRTWGIWGKVVIGCIPAAIVGFLLDSWVESHFFNAITVSIMLVVYGIAYIVVERIKDKDKQDQQVAPDEQDEPEVIGKHSRVSAQQCSREAAGTGQLSQEDGRSNFLSYDFQNTRSDLPSSTKRDKKVDRGTVPLSTLSTPLSTSGNLGVTDLSIFKVLGIGAFQCLAIIPGTSRSGSTILGGRILGVSRETAAEFSFFLAIPVMFGWSLLKIIKTLLMDGIAISTTEWGVLAVGVVVAFGVSILAIKFLMNYIKNHSFEAFGWYRIILGVLVLGIFLFIRQQF